MIKILILFVAFSVGTESLIVEETKLKAKETSLQLRQGRFNTFSEAASTWS